MKEAMSNAGLWNKKEKLHGIDNFRIGLGYSNVVKSNEIYFYRYHATTGQTFACLGFWVGGTLALEHNLNGHPGLNDMPSGGSAHVIGDAYNLIRNGY